MSQLKIVQCIDVWWTDNFLPIQITFIGRINSINQQSTHISYVLDDGTSTMEVKKWLDQYDNDFEAERRDAFKYGLFHPHCTSHWVSDWKTFFDYHSEGSYVRVTGHLRSFHNKKSMVAFHIRAVESADEIAHHNLEAIFVHLYLTKGPLVGERCYMELESAGSNLSAHSVQATNNNLATQS